MLFAAVAYIIVALPAPGQDFVAFYCAGKAVAVHADPHRALTTIACQHDAFHGGYMTVRNLVIPAPLPPYELLALRALSALPFDVAVSAWRIALIACLIVAVVALRAVSGMRGLRSYCRSSPSGCSSTRCSGSPFRSSWRPLHSPALHCITAVTVSRRSRRAS